MYVASILTKWYNNHDLGPFLSTDGLIFERRILRKIFGPICDNVKWRIRYNSELYSMYTDPDIIKTIKISKLRWMPEENPVKKLT